MYLSGMLAAHGGRYEEKGNVPLYKRRTGQLDSVHKGSDFWRLELAIHARRSRAPAIRLLETEKSVFQVVTT